MLVFKITDEKRQGHGGFQYPEVGLVECPDWKPTPDCGNGLHGWLNGEGDYRHHFNSGVFLVIDVLPEDLVMVGDDKCKFRAGVVVYSGTREGAVEYLKEHGALTKESNPAWACLTPDQLVKVAMRSADRAVRKHAPAALRRAGLEAEAAKLEALPTIDSESSARSAAWSAESARSAAWSAAESAESAWSAAESAAWSAAWSAESARSAAWSAAESAAWSAAESAESARSAESAAWSAEMEQTRLDKLEMLGLDGRVKE